MIEIWSFMIQDWYYEFIPMNTYTFEPFKE